MIILGIAATLSFFFIFSFLACQARGYNMEKDVMTYISKVEVTYQTECEDNPEGLCDKVWTKEYDPAVTKVIYQIKMYH